MKLYVTSGGQYCGTQADFYAAQVDECGGKKSDYDAAGAEVDVPTDKAGLISFLNNLAEGNRPDDVVVEDAPVAAAPAAESHTDKQVRFEDEFAGFSIAKKLHFASLAVEEARLLS